MTHAATPPLRLGLVGRGIGHSLSPGLHAKALDLAELSGSYALFDCATDGDALQIFARLRAGELDGLNVTTPFKALALQAADAWHRTSHHPAGTLPQPANTLFMKKDRLIAASTDGPGLTAALLGAQVEVHGKRVLLLGAGGAGCAVAGEFLALGARQLRVANRTRGPAERLVAELDALAPGRAIAHAWGVARGLASVDVIVHATRLGHGEVGLEGQLDWLPWLAWSRRRPLLVDLVYAPDLTPVQSLARARGLPLDARIAQPAIAFAQIRPALRQPLGVLQYFGQAMLAHQAAGSFALWTGRRVDALQLLAAILPTSCT